MQGRHILDIARYSAVSPEFCISRSTSTHRRTNSSGVSGSSVVVGSTLDELAGAVGGWVAVEEPSSLQAVRESRPQQARTARKRVTTAKTLPRSQVYVRFDASP